MKEEERKKWFKDVRFLVPVTASVVAVIVSAVALWQSHSANELSEEANKINRVSITPVLVAEHFVSYSIDFLDERDLKKIEREKVTIELPSDSGQLETNQQYAWLLIRNKGSGLAKIFSIEVTYSLSGNSQIKRFNWKETRVISSGEALAIYLGYFLGNLQFTDEVKVTYRSVLDEIDPMYIAFAPDGISLHVRNVASVTVTATPDYK